MIKTGRPPTEEEEARGVDAYLEGEVEADIAKALAIYPQLAPERRTQWCVARERLRLDLYQADRESDERNRKISRQLARDRFVDSVGWKNLSPALAAKPASVTRPFGLAGIKRGTGK